MPLHAFRDFPWFSHVFPSCKRVRSFEPPPQCRDIASTGQRPCRSFCDPCRPNFAETKQKSSKIQSFRRTSKALPDKVSNHCTCLMSTSKFEFQLAGLDIPHLMASATWDASFGVHIIHKAELSTEMVPMLSPEMIWWNTSLCSAPTSVNWKLSNSWKFKATRLWKHHCMSGNKCNKCIYDWLHPKHLLFSC